MFQLLFYSCHPDNECPPTQVSDDYIDSNHLWLNRHQIGDTLKFKVYKVIKDSLKRKYVLKGIEEYIATDSNNKVSKENISGQGCPKWENKHSKDLTFTGKRILTIGILPQADFDALKIIFENKEYRIYNDQFDVPGVNLKELYYVEGNEYQRVNLLGGYSINQWPNTGYVDSTIAFYNYDNGLIRLILNDTLVMNRIH